MDGTTVYRPRGRPARLSRERIVTAALELDLDTLTMQQLAARLQVAPSALYRWVSGRDELIDLIGETMTARLLPAAPPTAENWHAWLEDLAESIRREFSAVPGYAARVLTREHQPDAHSHLQEQVIRAFVLAGCAPAQAIQAWYVFATAIAGWLTAEQNPHFPKPRPMDYQALVAALLKGLTP
jgi:AcrR family transcriptional regulator